MASISIGAYDFSVYFSCKAVITKLSTEVGNIDVDTPSLAISLLPEYRGQGIGTKLLSNLLLGTVGQL